MPSNSQTATKQFGRRPPKRQGPAVVVIAAGREVKRLADILVCDGLFVLPSSGAAVEPADAVVLTVASLPEAKDAVAKVRAHRPSAPVVVVVAAATPAEARRLLVDDVPGLVLESDAEAALGPTVRAALARQIAYPAQLMPNQLRRALTKREKQMLGMVVLGFSNAEIAAKLFVSESTVKSHLSSAFATIGVRTRKEAAALILDPDAGFGTGILAITDSG